VDFCREPTRDEVVGGVVFNPSATTPDESEVISNASRRINVTDNSALGLPRAVIRIGCSKGTYVRAFARDLGEALGSGAHLDSLQRSRSGIFRVENALTVDQTMELLSPPQHTTH
jgi:tRNA pseudouridine55 synthase